MRILIATGKIVIFFCQVFGGFVLLPYNVAKNTIWNRYQNQKLEVGEQKSYAIGPKHTENMSQLEPDPEPAENLSQF